MSLQQNDIYRETMRDKLMGKYNISLTKEDEYLGNRDDLRNFFNEAEKLNIL